MANLAGPDVLGRLYYSMVCMPQAKSCREGPVPEMAEAPEVRRARDRAVRARQTAALVESEVGTVKAAPDADAGMEVVDNVAEEVKEIKDAPAAANAAMVDTSGIPAEVSRAEEAEEAEEEEEVAQTEKAGEPDDAGEPEEANEVAEAKEASEADEVAEVNDEAAEVNDGAAEAKEASEADEVAEVYETGEAEEAQPAVDCEEVRLPELDSKKRPSPRIAKKPACKAAPAPRITMPSPKRSQLDEELASNERCSKRKRVTLEQKLLEFRKLGTEDERERFLQGMSLQQRIKIATAMSLAGAGA